MGMAGRRETRSASSREITDQADHSNRMLGRATEANDMSLTSQRQLLSSAALVSMWMCLMIMVPRRWPTRRHRVALRFYSCCSIYERDWDTSWW